MKSLKAVSVCAIALAISSLGFAFAQSPAKPPSGNPAPPAAKKAQTSANQPAPHKSAREVPPPAPPRPIQVIPQPVTVKSGSGEFVFSARTQIIAAAGSQALAEELRGALQPAMGFPLSIVRPSATPTAGAISLSIERNLRQLGPEGYRLEITRSSIRIRAPAPAGLFYGIQTLRQLLPAETFRRSKVDGVRWSVSAATIEDTPRFSWRGVHLDVSRHFMSKEFIMKFLDLMALHKLNVFHWHLVDDQGWRIEIKKYPRLALIGGRTDYTTFNPVQPMQAASLPQGGYYTQDDIREVVRYAADRFITVVPEIEMPGHSAAAVAAYPELGNRLQIEESGGSLNFTPFVASSGTGSWDSNYNVDDSTIHFLQDVLSEVMALFPSKFIHIGGDEVDKRPWHANPKAQARMKELGLKDENELQSWFVRQMDQFIAAHGRRLVGWDEILEGGLAPGATVMSWRGMAGGVAAAKAGHDVVMAPTGFTYLDYYQAVAPRLEPLAIGGFLPLEQIYKFEPVAPELTPAEAQHVLGGQAQLWTEFMPHGREVEFMAWPRLSALAETVWSPRDARDFAGFVERLKPDIERFKILDVHYRPVTLIPPPVAHWQAGDAAAQFTEHEWDVSSAITAPGQYDASFVLTGGHGHLEIEWVELRENDAVVQRIVRPGSTDWGARSNDYLFGLQTFHAGSRYTVRASIRGVGGVDSVGDIYVVPQ
jgi:hexosaminidase